jgi:endonuclease YncB( thermonuclease family)
LLRPLLRYFGLVLRGNVVAILAVALLFALMISVSGFLSNQQPDLLTDGKGVRVYVVDGDTLRIGESVVRLQGIDAVELHQSCTDSDGGQWSCGLEARQALSDLVAQGGLICEVRGKDGFGRALSVCSTKASPDLAAALVTAGWALNRSHASKYISSMARSGYAIQQAQATSGRRGIWRGSFENPGEWRAAHPRDDE